MAAATRAERVEGLLLVAILFTVGGFAGGASSGASTRELMHRMGHSTMRAALIYQHATSERDREIASAMDRLIAGKRGSGGAGSRSRPMAWRAELLAREWHARSNKPGNDNGPGWGKCP